MNKVFCTLILMLCTLASLPAMAAEEDSGLGFWVEAGVASGKNPSWVTGYYEHSFTEAFGIYAVVEKESDGYREFYVGPKWKPLEWLEIGVGIGREIAPGMPSSVRRNAYFSADFEKVAIYGTFENGGSGPWHKVTAVYKFTETVSAGVMNETLYGTGPLLKYNVKKNVEVWGAMLRDHDTEKNTSLLAVNFSF